jgi:hypothetical protein
MEPTRPVGDQGGRAAELLELGEFDFSTPAYVRFSEQMDDQLARFVAVWQHLAAPSALKVGRISSLRGRP